MPERKNSGHYCERLDSVPLLSITYEIGHVILGVMCWIEDQPEKYRVQELSNVVTEQQGRAEDCRIPSVVRSGGQPLSKSQRAGLNHDS